MNDYEIGFNISNILDKKYQKPHGFSQDGRSLEVLFKNIF